ncbi:MAG: phage terminase large subunit family protein, partial [Candidatus Shapirobacteria bacterium]
FWQSSPISGQFDDSKYPLVRKPLLSLSEIHRKATVWYGPTQSIKSVLLQIATAYRLDVLRKSVLAVAQTDSDAKDFSTIKLKPFLERIPSLKNTVRKGAYSITLNQWLWATHELIISGPGENAQESKSVCFLHTDEAHRYCVEYPGAMAGLANRMGLRWDRHELHATTAADAGTEIDILYHRGHQNEWHVRCIYCNELFRPLWDDCAKETYNGARIFRWIDSPSETETLNSIEMRCPHCDGQILDTPRNRADMDDGADYIPGNPSADAMFQSFRWNAFAPRWKHWRDLLAIYLHAIHSAKLGNLKPYEDWVKKQEVRTWTGEFPLLGDSSASRDYKKSDIEIVDENKLRTLSIDRQEGKEGKGFHLWCLAEEWERDGKSRRVEYQEISSWTGAREMQEFYRVKSRDVGVDFGSQVGRDVFAACERWKWYALKSGDEQEFPHQAIGANNTVTIIRRPFSEARPEDPMSGKAGLKGAKFRSGQVPPGCCLSILWSKPTIYPIFYALKNGTAGRYYGIASDFNQVFIDQLHAYIPALDIDKKSLTTRKVIWQKVKEHDHSFVCGAQGLVIAARAGFYPMADQLATITP